jgi:hypothetical protein
MRASERSIEAVARVDGAMPPARVTLKEAHLVPISSEGNRTQVARRAGARGGPPRA